MKIMSYNVLCRDWRERSDAVTALVKQQQPDTFGLQEAHYDWIKVFCRALPQYSYVGVGRDDGDKKGEFSPVFYLTDKFALVDSGSFWLNETQDSPYLGWDAACIRICSYTLLRSLETQELFAHFNTHLDHVGFNAQVMGARLVAAKIKELYPDTNTVLTGDFNVEPQSEPYMELINNGLLDTRQMAKRTSSRGTYQAFDKIDTSSGRSTIDYIFTDCKTARVESFEVLRPHKEGELPASDHDPVCAILHFDK